MPTSWQIGLGVLIITLYVCVLFMFHYRSRAELFERLYTLSSNDYERLRKKTFVMDEPELVFGRTLAQWREIEIENMLLKDKIKKMED